MDMIVNIEKLYEEFGVPFKKGKKSSFRSLVHLYKEIGSESPERLAVKTLLPSKTITFLIEQKGLYRLSELSHVTSIPKCHLKRRIKFRKNKNYTILD